MPRINGQTQCAGPDYSATVVNYEQQTDGVTFKVDLTQAHDTAAGLDSFVRTFEWVVDRASRRGRLRLTDAFRFDVSQGMVEECFVSLYKPALAPGSVVWRGVNPWWMLLKREHTTTSR